jgi:hypothetical protein
MAALLVALVAAAFGPSADTPRSDRFVPPTYREAGRVVLPLTFTDGTRAELRYPPRLRLAQRGVVPYGSGHLRKGAARDFHIAPGEVDDVMAELDARLRTTFPGAGGATVGLWETPRDTHHHRLYLAFQFDRWTVLVYDYPRGAAAMTRGQRTTWARNMSGRETAAGFLRLSSDPPLGLARAGEHAGPQLSFGGYAGPLTLHPGRCRRTFDHDRRMYGRWVSWNRGYANWCVSRSMRADARGSRRWMRSLIRSLEVR